MKEYDEWKIVKWYCPNCGKACKSYINKKGVAKVCCTRCGNELISIKGKKNKKILIINNI